MSHWNPSHTYSTQGGMWGAGHMIQIVSPIIFWFPQMCHLSVQLHLSAGQMIRPDCGRQKGIRHGRFVAVSQSLWCHGADVTEAWFFSLQPEQDREDQRWFIIYSNIKVDPTESGDTCQVSGEVTPTSSTYHTHSCLSSELCFNSLQWPLCSFTPPVISNLCSNIITLFSLVKCIQGYQLLCCMKTNNLERSWLRKQQGSSKLIFWIN